MKKYKGSIKSIRQLIQGKILEDCQNFNAGLNIDRTVEKILNDDIKEVLATVIMKKQNEDIKLKNTLLESLKEHRFHYCDVIVVIGGHYELDTYKIKKKMESSIFVPITTV